MPVSGQLHFPAALPRGKEYRVMTDYESEWDPAPICACLSYTGLFEVIVGVLTTCHTQYTLDRSICILLCNRTTLQVYVTYLTGALYVHPMWFHKHQHDNRVRSKLFVAWQRWSFQWPFWFVHSVPGYLREEEEHKPNPWRNPIERNHRGCIWRTRWQLLKPRQSFRITLYINISTQKMKTFQHIWIPTVLWRTVYLSFFGCHVTCVSVKH